MCGLGLHTDLLSWKSTTISEEGRILQTFQSQNDPFIDLDLPRVVVLKTSAMLSTMWFARN